MSREIKFRFWDTQNKRWANDAFLYIDEDGTVWEIEERSWAMQSYMHRENVSDRYERVQYTGLKDKNGVEIYEGDVVHVIEVYDYKSETDEWNAPVVWDGAGWYLFDPKDTGCPLDSFGEGVVSLSEVKVIGNIYENADLLETAGESK